ncbi:hypothetical protein [Actinomadura sp. 6N118]|uniref:hypothetical protein n=1 Tax=Actinomadura sp. 6N118 TaxID=3375151 RepID=UPI0037B46AC9
MSKVSEHPPWASVDIDPERLVAELRRRFPGVCAWFGEFTGEWWAIAPGRQRLIKAGTPAALGRCLEELGAPRRAAVQAPLEGFAPEWVPAPPETGVAVAAQRCPQQSPATGAPSNSPSRASGASRRSHRAPRGLGRRLLGALVARDGAR